MPLNTIDAIRAAPVQSFRWAIYSHGLSTPQSRMVCLDYAIEADSVRVPYPPTPAGEIPTSYAGMGPLTLPGRVIRTLGGFSGKYGLAFYDRQWISGALSTASATTHTIDSPAFPARDVNEEPYGAGCQLGIITGESFVDPPTPSSGVVLTVTYTNSAGTTGRTSSMTLTSSNSYHVSFIPFWITDGVRSVQSLQVASSTQGAVQLALLRPLVRIGRSGDNIDYSPRSRYHDARLLRCVSALVPAGAVIMPMFHGVSVSWTSQGFFQVDFALEVP